MRAAGLYPSVRPQEWLLWRRPLASAQRTRLTYAVPQHRLNLDKAIALLYQDTDYKQFGGQQNWFSAAARPQVYFNNYVNLTFEPFVDWVNVRSGMGCF